jgi:hypothetical protein
LEARYLEFDFTLNPKAYDRISGYADVQFCRREGILTMEIASLRSAPINKDCERKVVVARHTFDFSFKLQPPDPLGRLRCRFKANCRGPRHGMGVTTSRSLEVGVPTIITTSRSSSSSRRSVRVVVVRLVQLRPPVEEF